MDTKAQKGTSNLYTLLALWVSLPIFALKYIQTLQAKWRTQQWIEHNCFALQILHKILISTKD